MIVWDVFVGVLKFDMCYYYVHSIRMENRIMISNNENKKAFYVLFVHNIFPTVV